MLRRKSTERKKIAARKGERELAQLIKMVVVVICMQSED